MKILYEDETGKHIELKEVQMLGAGDLIIRLNMITTDQKKEEMEKELSNKFKRTVVLLDTRFGEVTVVPPEK